MALEFGGSVLESCVVHRVRRLTLNLPCFRLFLTTVNRGFLKTIQMDATRLKKKKTDMQELDFEQQIKKKTIIC